MLVKTHTCKCVSLLGLQSRMERRRVFGCVKFCPGVRQMGNVYRLGKFTSAVRDCEDPPEIPRTSRHYGTEGLKGGSQQGPMHYARVSIKGPLLTPRYHSAVMFGGFQVGPYLVPHDAARRKSLGFMNFHNAFQPKQLATNVQMIVEKNTKNTLKNLLINYRSNLILLFSKVNEGNSLLLINTYKE